MIDDATVLRQALSRVHALGDLDSASMAATSARLDSLTKPPGSLGRLETLVIQLAGITGDPTGTYRRRSIIVAAADHGVVAQGVSAYPADVTPQMVANFLAGGAAINVLARQVGASLTVVDAGVAGDTQVARDTQVAGTVAGTDTARDGQVARTDAAGLIRAPLGRGTADMTAGPAMSRATALRSIGLGLEVASALERDRIELVGIGEMGIGNTTAASAIASAMTGLPPARVTGRGTGIDDATHARKIDLVARALERNGPDPGDPIGVLAGVGGFEIGVLVGVILGAAAARVPVVLDGFITGAAALLAASLAPGVAERSIAGHRSAEPGHAVVLERLSLRPLLELDLRLGEGTGAALAMSLIDAALAVRDGMATFGSAGVAGRATAAEPVS